MSKISKLLWFLIVNGGLFYIYLWAIQGPLQRLIGSLGIQAAAVDFTSQFTVILSIVVVNCFLAGKFGKRGFMSRLAWTILLSILTVCYWVVLFYALIAINWH